MRIYKTIIINLFFTILCCLTSTGQHIKNTLKIGDNAPKIEVEAWLKGEPILDYKPGHIYIVDFGFISCAPCRAAIPHLTKVAKQFKGRVTVISIFTAGDRVEAVQSLLDNIGDEMQYTVAVDGFERNMEKNWVYASGRSGYPTVMIIDDKGKLAWIGSNTTHLQETINELISGEGKTVGEYAEQIKRLKREIGKSTIDNLDANIKKLDSLISIYPEDISLISIKFKTLLNNNKERAYKYGWHILKSDVWYTIQGATDYLHKMALELPFGEFREKEKSNELSRAMRKIIVKSDLSTPILKNIVYELLAFSYYWEGNNSTGDSLMQKAIEVCVSPYNRDQAIEKRDVLKKRFAEGLPEIADKIKKSGFEKKHLNTLNDYIKKHPDNKYANRIKLFLLYQIDVTKAHDYAKEMIMEDWTSGNEHWLIRLSQHVLRYPEGYDISIAMNQKLLEITDDVRNRSDAYSTLSWVFFLKGDIEQGELMMQKALEEVPGDKYKDRRRVFKKSLKSLRRDFGSL